MINLSSVLIKSHHLSNERNVARKRSIVAETNSRVWLTGVSLFTIGNVFNFMAFNYAAQSLLAALGSIQFVSNVLFTRFLLNQNLTTRSYFGTGVIILGDILTLTFASHATHSFTTSEMLELYTRIDYIVYLCVALFLVIVCYWGCWYLERHPEHEYNQGLLFPFLYVLYSALIGTQVYLLFVLGHASLSFSPLL